MKVRTLFCLIATIVLSQSITANADSGDREALLTVMKKAFAAVTSGDPDDWRAIQLSEGTTLSFRPGPADRPKTFRLGGGRSIQLSYRGVFKLKQLTCLVSSDQNHQSMACITQKSRSGTKPLLLLLLLVHANLGFRRHLPI